ncbi:P-loop containing nucleoside triphosphate hydrolase protein [Russula earlei]|uniref:P-loop containing nucleoside triphosphate hydrolase protein n=1 Tax=Russula earlei TaxID=71964 RepID=A0ACC0UAC6_9AGAM|nr:P-loop containing nucleoside triphosphate hydrolase protein [Russula earlei]
MGPCSICCPSCASESAATRNRDSSHGPFAVQNLLPAGTLSLPIPQTNLKHICDHSHSAEGWHFFDGEALLPLLTDQESEILCRHLDFLVEHEFLIVQCKVGDSGTVLILRVYIVPYDLPGVQGRLRIRDEASELKPARLCLRNVMPRIIQDRNLWDSHDLDPSPSSQHYFLDIDTDNRTLAEIYSDLPSPVVDLSLQTSEPSRLHDMTSGIMLGDQIPGLRSRLYPYQRESVSAMLHKEMSESDIPDPLYIPIIGLNKTAFYLQPATLEILRECPMVAPHHGGVLCEELGTGKTIMILALVLATIDQLSKPEESIHDARPVLTPLAFRHFPYSQFEAARKRLSTRPSRAPMHDSNSFPRLMEILLHYVRTSPDGLQLRQNVDWLQNRGLLSFIELNAPFYLQSQEPATLARPLRKSIDRGFRTMYLTSATLIVVPPNLLAQWNSEILKHCLGLDESDDALRFLVVNPKDELPAAKVLASNYDIVLLNHETFAREVSKFDRGKAFTWAVCKCPGYKGSRVPDCKCDPPKFSPLFQIRWKRLVVDEGHVHGADRTNISKVASLLSVERRWLVTGTPTTHLLGINLRSSEGIAELQYPEGQSEEEDLLPAWEDLNPGTPSQNGAHPVNADGLAARTWTKYDREDLRRLGTMMITFLQMPRFAAEIGSFGNLVVRSLFGNNGPQPGAIQVLTQVMNSIMIRHQIHDIEADVSLPPMVQETVLLDLDPLAVKSYNALQAAITINAVDSERKDQDYLFHPNNAAYLKQLVDNMSQLMFWHVDERQYNVEELVKATDRMVEKAQERGVSLQDTEALREAKKHIIKAANDDLWRKVQTIPTPEVPFVVSGISDRLLEVWSELPYTAPTSLGRPPPTSFLMFALRLAKLRDIALSRPLIDENRLILAGYAQMKDEETRNAIFLQSVRKKAKSSKRRVVEENVRETRKAEEAARQRQDKVLEMQNELRLATEKQAHKTPSATHKDKSGTGHHRSPDSAWQIARSKNPLANAHLVTSRSSKLNYLLKEVLEYSLTEKFLIFSSMPLTLAHVADALTVMGIMFLQYTTASPVHIRQQYVTTFETSDRYRVFLMELKHGSRGLNLISASRVIFCEPVWKADVEAQAIKRVHRIGQTKPITIKTLAIRNSAEELMISRRAQLKSLDQKVSTFLTDDFTMRNFIANPSFMEETAYEPLTLDIPLLGRTAEETSPSRPPEPAMDAVVEAVQDEPPGTPDDAQGPTTTEQLPLKKRRIIRFAE